MGRYRCSRCGGLPATCICEFPDPNPVSCTFEEAEVLYTDHIQKLKNRIDYQEQDLLKNMGEIAILREAAGSEKEDLSRKIAQLEDQISELQVEPWPQWAETILKKLEEFGCYDRSVDDEVDLGELFLEWLAGFEDAEEREDVGLQNFRLTLRKDIDEMATEVSKINQWTVDRQKRPNSDYLEVATRMIEINRKMRADVRREETRRRTYYRPPED